MSFLIYLIITLGIITILILLFIFYMGLILETKL